MKTRCKILHVEDVSPDAELIARELKKSGILCEITVVDSKEEYEYALDSTPFDIVLCDHIIPGFNSFNALHILKEKKLNIPFIIVTATLTEDVAMVMVRDGADDYIFKDRLKRLPLAVENAVEKFRDEKDRKRLVDNLYDKETLSKELLTHLSNKILLATKVAGIGIWEFIFDEQKFIADDVMLLQFDRSAAQFDGDYKSLLSVVVPKDRDALVESMRMHMHTGTEFTVEYRVGWPDGSLHYMKAIGIVELNAVGGPYRIIGSNQDITSDKLSEQKIKESESRMAEVQLMAKIGSWETDMSTMVVSWSPETFRIFDLETTESHITHTKFLSFVHPDDKNFVDQSFSESVGKETANSIEHRIITAKGNLKYVEECWKFLYDDAGRPLRAVGSVQDITSSTKASMLIMESEAKYRSLIDSSMDGILLTLKTGEILAANLAACILLKMTEAELLTLSCTDIVDKEDPCFIKLFQERTVTGRARGELTFIRKDKSRFPGESSSVIFTNAEGEERVSIMIRDVSSRKNAEQKMMALSSELQDALNGLNRIMDSSLDVICAVDEKGLFRKVSAASETVWGYRPQELIGQPLINFVHKEDNEKTQLTANQVMQGQSVNHFENRYIKKDGSLVSIEWTARWDEKDKMRYGVARDVTTKKMLEKAFEVERLRFQDIFLQAPCIMAVLKGPDHVFKSANKLCLQFFGTEDIIGKCFFDVLPDVVSQGFLRNLDSVFNTGIPFQANERKILLENQITGEFEERYINVTKQVNKNPKGEIEGVLFFAIDVSEQVLSRKKKEESEMKYRQIVEMAQEGIWVIDKNDVTTFVNRKMSDILGYSVEEMVGQEIFHFMDEAGVVRAKELMVEKELVGPEQFYYKFISKQGNAVWALVSSNPVFDVAGVYDGAMAMITDMTEIRQAGELLRQSEQRYRRLYEQNLAGFYQSTFDGKLIHCNEAFAHMLKYDSADEIMQVNAMDLYFSEEDRNKFISGVVTNKSLYNYEGIVKCKDGSASYFLENVAVHVDPKSGIEYFDGIIIDITEKKEAELQLKESNERFTKVSKAAFDVIWDWDITHNLLYLGDRFEELFGYHAPSKENNLDTWSSHIHPQDKERVLNSIQFKIDNNDEKAWVEEYRYICADGRLVHVLHRGMFNKSSSSRIVGAMQDITEIKELENLFHKATSLAKIGSWEFNPITNKLYWSEVVREIHEIDVNFQPVLKSLFNFCLSKQDSEFLQISMEDAVLHGDSFDEEVEITTAQKNKKWIRIIGHTEFIDGRCLKVYGSLQDITQRKISELDVARALVDKNIILESIGDAFFAVDHDWNVTYWNNQAEAILFKSKREIIGRNLWEEFSESIDSILYTKYHEAVATNQVVHFEDYYPPLKAWYEISAYPSDNGLSVYFKDITNRKVTDEAVRASEEVRKLIMDAAMDAIVCINDSGRITVWNPEAEKIFGWSAQEIVGEELTDTIIPVHLCADHKRGMSKYQLTGHGARLRKPFETSAINKYGREFPIELSIIPVKQGDTEFFCAFIRDISARKLAEASLSMLHNNLMEQSKKLQTSNEELEKYAYVTSHDLQEPLRMVTSFLQLLQKKYENQLDDTAQKYINFAVDGASRMKILILDLLEFSRISSVQIEHKMFSLNDVVKQTLLSLKASIDETNAVIMVADLPEVPGNEIQLMQLFQNLLSNAIKYKGSADPVIEIGVSETKASWQFSIKDNGVGILPKYYDKIFIIFQRLHNKKDYKGTGIGLAICKKIVELHNGKIWVESTALGSTFHFTLQKTLPETKRLENLI